MRLALGRRSRFSWGNGGRVMLCFLPQPLTALLMQSRSICGLSVRAALELYTAHLCYLVVLGIRAERGNLASLAEDDLVDLYLQVAS